MQRLILTGTEILAAGIPQSPAVALAMDIAAEHFTAAEKGTVIAKLKEMVNEPGAFTSDEVWGKLAVALMPTGTATIRLSDKKNYSIYGAEGIEEGAVQQMDIAMQLPVTFAGALMPDAHHGYGLPIGGVLATDNAIIPYGVGVDIGCRMSLTVFDIEASYFEENNAKFKRELIAQTLFGAGGGFKLKERADHPVLESEVFKDNPFVAQLKEKAWAQLGSSGGGNHFVEWGVMEFAEDDATLGLSKGKYIALLSHSGSRGLGATIAGHYTKIAKELCRLPKEAANLAYLGLDTAEGQDYWAAMNLAGAYASANHEVIHAKMIKAIGGHVLTRVENHHNFAWKEAINGKEVIVHRKGATPAGDGVLGIIPGSMTAPGYLVRGKGNLESISSASHGAGRQMSRTKATQSFTRATLKQILKDHGVTLIGGGTDEAPGAYKDIKTVMSAQKDLVDVIASFTPKMVRMADDGSRED